MMMDSLTKEQDQIRKLIVRIIKIRKSGVSEDVAFAQVWNDQLPTTGFGWNYLRSWYDNSKSNFEES